MESIQHDPKTKLQIKEALYSFLYRPVLKQYKLKLDNIILRNSMLMGSSHMSFIYKGVVHSCDSSPMPRKMTRLSPQLHTTMDEYLFEIEELNKKEIPYVVGFINKVLNSSNELHDYLRILPASIHKPIEQLIATCPCRAKSLTEDAAKTIKDQNEKTILLIKQRLMFNLLS